MTTFALSGASPAKSRADAVVVGVLAADQRLQLAAGGADVASAYGRKLAPLLAALGVTGKAGEVVKVPTGGTISSPLLVLVGLGSGEPTPVTLRRAAGAAARAVTNAASVALALPVEEPDQARAVVEGYLLGGYGFVTYKSGAEPTPSPAEVVLLGPSARRKPVQDAVEEAQVLAAAVAATRDWVNTPPGDLRPPGFADQIAAAAKPKGRRRGAVTATVRDEQWLAEHGCGGLIGVGRGSDAPPRLVELRYRPKNAVAHLALVGKGITFDSGGLTIKPAQSMHEMKSDMAGAAAVVQATLAVAELGLPVRLSTYAALAENMIGSAATRPGDVLTLASGTTVEVLNTDAEGRLVLADALHYAVGEKPDLILDVATLTGHMVVALGDKVAGVMGDDATVARVLDAARVAGEDLWPMPIPDEMRERIASSKIADLAQHDWIRWGGGLYAAAFLREFTGGLPWAHLDIAGPSFNSGGPTGHWTSGGTGVGVTTLVEFVRALGRAGATGPGGPAACAGP